jgi:uncharacterized RDD family membrane protein YckC
MTEHRDHRESEEHDEHKEITIETLSTPPVKIRPAPLAKRFAAGMLDSLIIGSAWFALVLATGSGPSLVAFLTPSADTYLAVLVLVYFVLLEGALGATVGKFVLRLRVVGRNGELCSLGAAFTRNILRFVDWLPLFYILGAVAILTSPKRQRIGDRLAGTTVSAAPEKDINPPPAPFLFH